MNQRSVNTKLMINVNAAHLQDAEAQELLQRYAVVSKFCQDAEGGKVNRKQHHELKAYFNEFKTLHMLLLAKGTIIELANDAGTTQSDVCFRKPKSYPGRKKQGKKKKGGRRRV